MIAAGNARRHTLTTVQLAITGLALVLIAGCRSDQGAKQFVNGGDTPIVISGGSVHFKAKDPGWSICDRNAPSSAPTCYKAAFTQANKKKSKHYQFINDDGPVAVPVANAATGWEMDVVDTNPDNKHMVRVCTEIKSDYTCDTSSLKTDSIYVIGVGGGTVEMPDSTQPKKILYHDGDPQYDQISSIVLNVSGGNDEITKTCTDSHCFLYLSK